MFQDLLILPHSSLFNQILTTACCHWIVNKKIILHINKGRRVMNVVGSIRRISDKQSMYVSIHIYLS